MGLTYSSVVCAEPDEVFAWHSRPGAITRLMPPWQPVRVAREAPSVRDGQAVLALPGGLRWVAGHDPDGYDPPRQFVDVLQPPLGSALRWRHTHRFAPAPAPAEGTVVTDVISTPVPAWALRPMVGYRHRHRHRQILTEDSERGDGFLADVVAAWEDAAAPASAAGIRSVQVRTGVVQTPRGGLLRLLYPVFEAGLGGPIGSGRGWLPWIEIDDLLDSYLRAVTDPALTGPVNAVAPEPARNAEYTRTLGRVLRRPALIPVPPIAPRLLLGDEGARELAQASQRVRPGVLAGMGHPFRYPNLDGALRHVLGRTQIPASFDLPRQPGAAGRESSPIPDITNPDSPTDRMQT
jgi:hypothetical protein